MAKHGKPANTSVGSDRSAALENEFLLRQRVANRIDEITGGQAGAEELRPLAARLAGLAGGETEDALKLLIEIAQRARVVREAVKISQTKKASDAKRRAALNAAIKANDAIAAIAEQFPAPSPEFSEPYLAGPKQQELLDIAADDRQRLYVDHLRKVFADAASMARAALEIMDFEGPSTKGENDAASNEALREIRDCVDQIQKNVNFDHKLRNDMIDALRRAIGLNVGAHGDRDALRKRIHRLKS